MMSQDYADGYRDGLASRLDVARQDESGAYAKGYRNGTQRLQAATAKGNVRFDRFL